MCYAAFIRKKKIPVASKRNISFMQLRSFVEDLRFFKKNTPQKNQVNKCTREQHFNSNINMVRFGTLNRLFASPGVKIPDAILVRGAYKTNETIRLVNSLDWQDHQCHGVGTEWYNNGLKMFFSRWIKPFPYN
jgi:hypothetical protein